MKLICFLFAQASHDTDGLQKWIPLAVITAVMVGLLWWIRARSQPLRTRSLEYMDRLEARTEEIVTLLRQIRDKLDTRD